MLDGRRHKRVSQTPLRTTHPSRPPLCGKERSSSTQTRGTTTLPTRGGAPRTAATHQSERTLQCGCLLRVLEPIYSLRCNAPLHFVSITLRPVGERAFGNPPFPPNLEQLSSRELPSPSRLTYNRATSIPSLHTPPPPSSKYRSPPPPPTCDSLNEYYSRINCPPSQHVDYSHPTSIHYAILMLFLFHSSYSFRLPGGSRFPFLPPPSPSMVFLGRYFSHLSVYIVRYVCSQLKYNHHEPHEPSDIER